MANPLREHLNQLYERALKGEKIGRPTYFYDTEVSMLSHGITDTTLEHASRYEYADVYEYAAALLEGEKLTPVTEVYAAPGLVEIDHRMSADELTAAVSRRTRLTNEELDVGGKLGRQIKQTIKNMSTEEGDRVVDFAKFRLWDPETKDFVVLYRPVVRDQGKYYIGEAGISEFSLKRFRDIIEKTPGEAISRAGKARVVGTSSELAEKAADDVKALLEHVAKVRAIGPEFEDYAVEMGGANTWFDILTTRAVLKRDDRFAQTADDLINALTDQRIVVRDVQSTYRDYVYYLSRKYQDFTLDLSHRAVKAHFGEAFITALKEHGGYADYFRKGELVKNIPIDEDLIHFVGQKAPHLVAGVDRDTILKYAILGYTRQGAGQKMEQITALMRELDVEGAKGIFSHHAIGDIPREVAADLYVKALAVLQEPSIEASSKELLEAEDIFRKAFFKVIREERIPKLKGQVAKKVAKVADLLTPAKVIEETMATGKMRYGKWAMGAFAALAAAQWLASRKKEDYNTIEGLPSGWYADQMKEQTDFGSPYQGPKTTLPLAQSFMSRSSYSLDPYFKPQKDRQTGSWSSSQYSNISDRDWIAIGKRAAIVGGTVAGITYGARSNPYIAYRVADFLENLGVKTRGGVRFPGAVVKAFGWSAQAEARMLATTPNKLELAVMKTGLIDKSLVDKDIFTPLFKASVDLLEESNVPEYVETAKALRQAKNAVTDIHSEFYSDAAMDVWDTDRKQVEFVENLHRAGGTKSANAETLASSFEREFNVVLGRRSTTEKGYFERVVLTEAGQAEFEALVGASPLEKKKWLAEVLADQDEFDRLFKVAGGDTQHVFFRVANASTHEENKRILGGHMRKKLFDVKRGKGSGITIAPGARWNEFLKGSYASDAAETWLQRSTLGQMFDTIGLGEPAKFVATQLKRAQILFGLGPGRNEVLQIRKHLTDINAEGVRVDLPFIGWTKRFGKSWEKFATVDSRSVGGAAVRVYEKVRRGIFSGLRSLSEGLNRDPIFGLPLSMGLDPRSIGGVRGLATKLAIIGGVAYGAWHYLQYLDEKTRNEQGVGVLGKVWWAGLRTKMFAAKMTDKLGLRGFRDTLEDATPDHPLVGLGIMATIGVSPSLIQPFITKWAPDYARVASELDEKKVYRALFKMDESTVLDEIFEKRLRLHLTERMGLEAEDISEYFRQKQKIMRGTATEVEKKLMERTRGIDQATLSFTRKVLNEEMNLALPEKWFLSWTGEKALKFEQELAETSNIFLKTAKRSLNRFRPKTFAGLAWIAGAVVAGPTLAKMVMPKNTAEELEEIYSGRQKVPIRKGRWWTLSKTPLEGERVAYWRQHAFHLYRTRAKMKAIYGSDEEYWARDIFVHPIRALKEPRALHVAYQHYEDRPYPMEPRLGENLPSVLGAVAPVITGMIRKPRLMHEEEWLGTTEGGDTAYYHPTGARSLEPFEGLGGTAPHSPKAPGLGFAANELKGRLLETAGIQGFKLNTLHRWVFGKEDFDAQVTYLASAGAITSLQRQWYDMELGDIMGSTEALRRFVNKDRLSRINQYNPIRNRMPTWLTAADDYLNIAYGDPYTKVQEGELRLPGPGYEALYPELEGVPAEEYPLWARYQILADIFPYSQQTKRLQRRVEDMAQTDPFYANLLEVTKYQNKMRETRVHTYEKRFLNDNIAIQEVTVKAVTEKGIIAEEMPSREIRLSGIETSTSNITAINEYIASKVEPGEKIKILTHNDPAIRLKRDEDTTYMNAIVYKDGQNLNKEIIDNNLARFEEKEQFDVPFIKHDAGGRMLGKWAEFLGRGVNYMPSPFGLGMQKLSAQRTAKEHYAWGEAYGSQESYWHRAWTNIIKPIYTYNLHKAGVNDVPSHIQQRRDIIEYFDILEYIKYRRLQQQAKIVGDIEAAKHYTWKMKTTMYGANPYGAVSRWKYIADRREQPFIDAFVNASADDRGEILQMVPGYMRDFYMAQWGKQQERLIEAQIEEGNASEENVKRLRALRVAKYTQGETITPELWEQYQKDSQATGESYVDWIRRNELTNYFKEKGLPGEDWVGWDPRVDLEDIKLKLVQNKGLDMHDYNLWEDREAALLRKPYLDGTSIPDINANNRRHMQEVVDTLTDVLELEDRISYNMVTMDKFSSNPSLQVNVEQQMNVDQEYSEIIKRAAHGRRT